MKAFWHRQQEPEPNITGPEEELSVEDILAEYQARQELDWRQGPAPDGRGEYYSSSQGGEAEYYDSASFTPEDSYAQFAYGSDLGGGIDSGMGDVLSPDYGDYGLDLSRYESYQQPSPEPEEDVRVYAPKEPEGRSVRSGKIGATEREAWAYIAQLQRRAAEAVQPEAQGVEEQEPEVQIDSRFNLSGKDERRSYYFGDREIDMGAEQGYAPVRQADHGLRHWAPEPDPEEPAEAGEEEEEPRKGLFRRRKKSASTRKAVEEQEPFEEEYQEEAQGEAAPQYSSQYETRPQEPEEPFTAYVHSFRDHGAAPADYARDRAYDQGRGYDDGPEDYEEDIDYDRGHRGSESFPGAGPDMDREPRRKGRRRRDMEEDSFDEEGGAMPSFGEYLASLLAAGMLRLRGTSRRVTADTMDEGEDLGPELTPAGACKFYGSFIHSQRLRLRIAGGLWLVLAYLSLGLPIPGMLQDLKVGAAACCAIQFVMMLIALDVVTTAFLNAFRGRLGADFLAVLSCLVTTADGLLVALGDLGTVHTPLCALSSLSLLGVMASSSVSTRALRKTFRVPAIGRFCFAVTGEEELVPGELSLLKSLSSAKNFVRRAEEAPPDEELYKRLGPVLAILCLVLSLGIAAIKKCFPDTVYIYSALLSAAAPAGALLAFALPFFAGSLRLFRRGAAIAGWSGLRDIGLSRNLIVTDRDLFPESSIEIETVKVFSDISAEKVVAYAGTLVCASGSCLAPSFTQLMEENGCAPCHVDGFECLSGGGLRGMIEGHTVLCGSAELMRLMNVRLHYRLVEKTSVLLAIDGILYGIFNISYQPLPKVRQALIGLMRSGRHPVFAVRDFNVNPELLHNVFDLATDGYDFPPYVERFPMTEPAKGSSQVDAVICTEGLDPLTQVADLGRTMYLAVRLALAAVVLISLAGILLVTVRLIALGSVTILNLLAIQLAGVAVCLLAAVYVAAKP